VCQRFPALRFWGAPASRRLCSASCRTLFTQPVIIITGTGTGTQRRFKSQIPNLKFQTKNAAHAQAVLSR
jgi:hypothetical protein